MVGLGFAACEAVVRVPTYVVEWPQVDRALPFVPAMIWPYLFWYVAIAVTLGWLGWRDGPAFRRLCWFLYGAMSSTYVLYLLFPNGQALRPDVAGLGTGPEADLLRWLYSHDTPTNVNPSLHVIDTMAVWFAWGREAVYRQSRTVRAAVALVCLAIIASTVLIKQHSVLDIATGLAWSLLWYGLIYSRWSPWFTRLSRF